ncbi:TonB family protein [Pedobacter faecalis]|uniref:TonB family protein n=1 Tax=Pedobacter faecalis TaxID=3041495 RepID=UPI00254F3B15|nr:TonB family protein [Pedobacter sp. ELA7]
MKGVILALFVLSTAVKAQQPVFKGGLENFITKNKMYPMYSLQNCIEGQVIVAFKVDRVGNVFYSEVRNGPGIDLDKEALRLIRLTSGKWIVPAEHDTATSVLVPINFQLSGYDCASKSQEVIAQAIRAYKNNESLTAAVRNFYRNKASGTFTKAEESRILALKETLGYDEAYLQQRLSDGRKKLEQNDKQGACEEFQFVKDMGSEIADELLARHCN